MLLAQPVRTANCHLRAFGEALQIDRVAAPSTKLGGEFERACQSIPFVPAFDAWEGISGYLTKVAQERKHEVSKARESRPHE